MLLELIPLLATAVAAVVSQLAERRGRRTSAALEDARADVIVLYLGPFTYSWLSFVIVAGSVGVAFVAGASPGQGAVTRGDYQSLFATAAQVIVGLLVVMVVELATRGLRGISREATGEAVQALSFISLGLLMSLVGLLPRQSSALSATALALVAGSVVAALIGVVSLALMRRPSSES